MLSSMQPVNPLKFIVLFKTPDGIGIWKKSRIIPQNDFVEFTFKVSVDPPLGTWSVVAKLDNVVRLYLMLSISVILYCIVCVIIVNLLLVRYYARSMESRFKDQIL